MITYNDNINLCILKDLINIDNIEEPFIDNIDLSSFKDTINISSESITITNNILLDYYINIFKTSEGEEIYMQWLT